MTNKAMTVPVSSSCSMRMRLCKSFNFLCASCVSPRVSSTCLCEFSSCSRCPTIWLMVFWPISCDSSFTRTASRRTVVALLSGTYCCCCCCGDGGSYADIAPLPYMYPGDSLPIPWDHDAATFSLVLSAPPTVQKRSEPRRDDRRRQRKQGRQNLRAMIIYLLFHDFLLHLPVRPFSLEY